MHEEKLGHRIEQFNNSLATLEAAVKWENDSENMARDSTIQRFEYTLEMGWKLLQYILKDERVALPVSSPRAVIKAAHATGLIADGDNWIRALDDRNDMSHMYSGGESEGIYRRIKDVYVDIFIQLRELVNEQYI